jgi:hypothetical protein
VVSPTKWVVPGRRVVWDDPTLKPAPRRAVDRRLAVALGLAAAALALGLLVIRLSRPEPAGPGPGARPADAPAFLPDTGVYESENVRIQFRPAPAEPEAKEESR